MVAQFFAPPPTKQRQKTKVFLSSFHREEASSWPTCSFVPSPSPPIPWFTADCERCVGGMWSQNWLCGLFSRKNGQIFQPAATLERESKHTGQQMKIYHKEAAAKLLELVCINNSILMRSEEDE
jgi:hypothetical protein